MVRRSISKYAISSEFNSDVRLRNAATGEVYDVTEFLDEHPGMLYVQSALLHVVAFASIFKFAHRR